MTSYLDNPPTQIFDVDESDYPDTKLVSDTVWANAAEGEPSKMVNTQFSSSLLSDVLVYVAIWSCVGFTWWISRLGLFKSGDDIGYWLGVVGAVMMLMLFSYPIRKHFRFSRNWGRVKFWLWAHMVLGVAGPMFILSHSTFRIGSTNAAVALFSMVIVALSGVIGRFIYARVNRGLHGEKSRFEDLQFRAGMEQEDARSRLAFSPKVEQRLIEFQKQQLKLERGFLTDLRQVMWLPVHQLWVYEKSVSDLRRALASLAKHHGWSSKELVRRNKHAKKLVWLYLIAVTRVAQFTAYERMFALWHVLHIPFVYLMVGSVLAHVAAVHIY
ncbi:MAG: hypothetical protein RLZZ371_1882 [Pseudomonadota bacterium]